ncbi:G protein-coupled receptor 137Ba-like isoform X2 [Physella acuta]|uniref:G protein-coupled receptor 137Ba-like isoform X2 n=1 Tax=Physella acuta TaxID=109671 RepID=UPI0027DDB571|nr:G protein-coupled receptor 137Ba-like isoform X2 [Physella acuta]
MENRNFSTAAADSQLGDSNSSHNHKISEEFMIKQSHILHQDEALSFSSELFPSFKETEFNPTISHDGRTTTSSWGSLPTLQPALPSTVQLSLTIVYIVMFSLIFILVYVQLWMIWYYRHKRLSHQTLFLFMGLLWAGLRTSLFSFYFYNCEEANNLEIALYWLLYSFPVCLQFSMLCLLLHFFAQVVFKAKAKYEPKQYQRPLRLFLGLSVMLFTAMNLACAIVTKQHERDYASVPLFLLYIRVTITETMFLIYGILLSVCIFKMTKMASSQRVLEAKGTTVKKAVAAAILITLLFLSRTVYNLISICPAMKSTPNFGYDWINVTDQADSVPRLSESLAYVSFGMVLFVWEVLPISIVVIFFRVKRFTSGQVLTDFSSQSHGSRVFFFDNPRRYDSEDDLSTQQGSSPHADYGGARTLSGVDSFRSHTPRGTPRSTPINAPVWGYYSSASSYPHPNSPLATTPNNNTVIHSPRRHGYGAIIPSGQNHLRPHSSALKL